jgi:hypothetical protein
MLLYTDVVSGDEMISDGFKLIEVDNFAYEVDCKVCACNRVWEMYIRMLKHSKWQ